jgi:alanine dehydrogenase
MVIGVPKEIVAGEKRVAVTPEGVAGLAAAGHTVLVERAAGAGSGYADEAYAASGANLFTSTEALWAAADLVAKVKQPLEAETDRFHPGLIYLGYCHAVYRPWLVDVLLARRVTTFAAEEVALPNGDRPLLIPMSEIAGRLAVLTAAHYLAEPPGLAGVMLGCLRGQACTHVLIIGAGTVGRSAAAVACALGAEVTVFDRDPDAARDRLLATAPQAHLHATPVTRDDLEALLPAADAVINAVLWDPLTGEHLVTREGLRRMRRGSVIVDVDCTPGGVIETSRPMTLDDPTFVEEGVIHYCVYNMPASVPQTSTCAYAGALLPYLELIAGKGIDGALAERPELRAGLVTRDGLLLDAHIGEAQGREVGDQNR